jgi:estrone sulfotransferase
LGRLDAVILRRFKDRREARRSLKIAAEYAVGFLGLRDEDILLASYAKSGSTWVRFFLCNLISIGEWGAKGIDWQTLDATLPELGVSNLLRAWPHPAIPRFVKTHKPYWPIFRNKKSLLVVRDPRDVMVSFYHYRKANLRHPFEGGFSEFLRNREFGLDAWFRHYASWRPRCTALVSYEALRKNDVREFDRMLRALHVEIPLEVIAQAAEKSKFDRMRAVEKRSGISNADMFKADFTFTRKGKSGGWREYFSEEDMAYYRLLSCRYGVDLQAHGYAIG